MPGGRICMTSDRTITLEDYKSLAHAAAREELTAERRRCVEAMRLWMRLRDEVDEAVAGRNRDRYKRLLQTTTRARERLTRRWSRLAPPPATRLGDLRVEAWPKPARHMKRSPADSSAK